MSLSPPVRKQDMSAKHERNEQAKPPDAGQLKVKVIRAVERDSKIFRNRIHDVILKRTVKARVKK